VTIRVPGWLWAALAGLMAVLGLIVLYLSGGRRPSPGAPNPYGPDPALDLSAYREEVEVERANATLEETHRQISEVSTIQDADERTKALARLLERW